MSMKNRIARLEDRLSEGRIARMVAQMSDEELIENARKLFAPYAGNPELIDEDFEDEETRDLIYSAVIGLFGIEGIRQHEVEVDNNKPSEFDSEPC